VGRTLGWNLLKSSRFELSRQGSFVLFRGSGFGHGLGLCQLGAHAMAEQGADFRSITAQYFPGTLISERDATRIQRRSVLSTSDADRLLRPSQKDFRPDTRVKESPSAVADSAHAVSARMDARLSLASNNFQASFAVSANRRLVSKALTILEQFRGELEKQISSAGIGKANLPRMELFIHASTGDFTGSTGQPAFVAAITNGRRIDIQPLEILEKRRVLETALRHEYAHAVIEGNGPPSQPRWLSEGASIYLSGEGSQYSQVRPLQVSSPGDLESKFQQNLDRNDTRALYSAAYKEVLRIVGREGVPGLWRKLARPN
jgi:hypothetical protein